MMKYLVLIMLFMSSITQAGVIQVNGVKITQLNSYDDYEGGVVYIYINNSSGSCNGAYINPSAPGFQSLYSLTLAAFMSGKTVNFQLYDDRLISGRCEVDGIQVMAE